MIYLSPQGPAFTQKKARELAAADRIILICGRYEGLDERFIEREVDEELSIGDYVLSGGELAAAVVIDAIGRLQEGALNDSESANQDSFEDGLLDCPHYTRSDSLGTEGVPPVLLSGRPCRDQALAAPAEPGAHLAAPAGPARAAGTEPRGPETPVGVQGRPAGRSK